VRVAYCVDAGPYQHKDRELQPTGKPEQVNVHDFIDPNKGKAIPYGIYDLAKNLGWVNVGTDHVVNLIAATTNAKGLKNHRVQLLNPLATATRPAASLWWQVVCVQFRQSAGNGQSAHSRSPRYLADTATPDRAGIGCCRQSALPLCQMGKQYGCSLL